MKKYISADQFYLLGMLCFFALLRIFLPIFPLDGIWEGNQFFRFFLPTDAPPLFNKIITRANIGPYGDSYGYALLGAQRYILDFLEVYPSLSSIRSILIFYYILTGFFFYRVNRIVFNCKLAISSTFLFLSHSWILGYSDYFQPVLISLLVMLILIDRSYYLFNEQEKKYLGWKTLFKQNWGKLLFLTFSLVCCWFLGHPYLPILPLPIILLAYFLYKKTKKESIHWNSAVFFTLKTSTFGAAAALASTHYIFVRFIFLIILGIFLFKLIPFGALIRSKNSLWLNKLSQRALLIFVGISYFLIFLKISWKGNFEMFFNSIYVRVNQGSLAESVLTFKSTYSTLETIQFNFFLLWHSFLNGKMFVGEGSLDFANFFLDGYYQFTTSWFFIVSLTGLVFSYKKLSKEYFFIISAVFMMFLFLPHLSVIHTSSGFLNPSYSTHRLVFLLLPLISLYVLACSSTIQYLEKKVGLGKKIGSLCLTLLVITPGLFECYRYTDGLVSFRDQINGFTYEDGPSYLFYKDNPRDKAPQRGVRIYFYLLAKKIATLQKEKGPSVAVMIAPDRFFPKKIYTLENTEASFYHLGSGTETPLSHIKTYLPVYLAEEGIKTNYVLRANEWARKKMSYDVYLVTNEDELNFFKSSIGGEVIPLDPPAFN